MGIQAPGGFAVRFGVHAFRPGFQSKPLQRPTLMTRDVVTFQGQAETQGQAKSPEHGTQSPEVAKYLASFPRFGPPPFNAAFHAERRTAFLSKLPPNTTVVIPGTSTVLRNGDVSHPFRQESNLYYLTGFDEPDTVAILSNVPGQPAFTLLVTPRDLLMETWNGKRAGVEKARNIFGADAAYENTHLETALAARVRQGGPIRVLDAVAGPALNRRVHKALQQAGWSDMASDSQAFKNDADDIRSILDEMRLIKTPYEQALLKRACDISAEAHKRAMRKARLTAAMQAKDPDHAAGRNEGEVQAEVEYDFRRHGAVRVGYGSIAGGGANGCVLHYVTNTAFVKPDQLMLVDAGAEYGYYTADITRTWPVGGKFSPEQKALYNLVLKAQETGIRMTRPGVTLAEIHRACARVITEGLVELGILKGNPDQLLRDKAYFKYFMHGTSHMLGLDVHDVPVRRPAPKLEQKNTTGLSAHGGSRGNGDLNANGGLNGNGGLSGDNILRGGEIANRPLEPGMFLTVEPGIYIDPKTAAANGVDPKWRGIGIRIEDDILVTESGHENFSANAPRTPEEIEALMNS